MTGTLNRENATCRWLLGQPAPDNSMGWSSSSSSLIGQEAVQGPMAESGHQFCGPNFDKSLCWFNVSLGSVGHRPCPFQFCSSVPGCDWVQEAYTASRSCHENGTWGDSVYSECIHLLRQHQHCVVGYCRTCPDPLRDTVIRVSLCLSVVSVCVLLAALLLFSAFDSVQCRRLSIHKNLSAAFVLRFAILAIWTLLNTRNAFRDCAHFVPQPLLQWEWLCKAILFGVIFFQVASVMWMLIEGVYLYSRFTVLAMRRSEMPYSVYLFTGWGVPFLAVLAWALVHEGQSRKARSFCWLPYAQGSHLWILAGTMGLALILNVLLLLAIVLILVQKLRSESTAESKKIWKTVKATMLLVPLLGASNIPLFYEPSKPSAFYMLGSAILQHSQGIFIAVLYCFLNAEIQNALKRQLGKIPLLRSIGFSGNRGSRHHFETERTFLPVQTTMTGGEEEGRHHLAMQDLPGRARNGTARRGGPRVGSQTVQSNSLTTGLNRHAQPEGSNGDLSSASKGGGANEAMGISAFMSNSCGPLMDLAEPEMEAAMSEQRLISPD